MEREEIFKQLQGIFKTVLGSLNVTLTDSTTAEDVDGWDSLVHVELVNAIEKHFSVKFSVKEMLKWDNVGKMVDCISGKL